MKLKALLILVATSLLIVATAPADRPTYKDPSQPISRRVEDLLERMTLEEKVGQMNMPCVYEDQLGRDVPAKMNGVRKFAEGTAEKGIGPGGGFFTLANTILLEGPSQQAKFFNEIQRIALEKTRLGIPLLETEEGTHGLMCSGGTIFPEGLALGSTWNPELIRRIYAAAAKEARSVGIHQLFTLVVEPNRDPRLGRNQEGYGEDPYLISRFAEAIVEAIQGDNPAAADKAVAGLCHYPGQSQPVGGLERGAMEISERMLREVFLPSWVAGIKKHGALGVMATYPAIDAMPTHASNFILTRILREELGFDGLVLSEGGGLGTIAYEGLADHPKDIARLALEAGLDVGISYEQPFLQPLVEGVREGRIPVQLVDRAVRRILKQKFRLGLFENPYVDEAKAARTDHVAEHRAIALEAARQGIILLKNEGNLLPLKKDLGAIAVIGPNADNVRNQLGDYTSKSVLQHVITVLEGIKTKVGPSTRVTYVKGCDVIGNDTDEIVQAATAARQAQAAIVVIGENEWQTPGDKGTDGEGYDCATLELTGRQEELVKAVVETGTPTVVITIAGRPLAIRWIAEHVPAIVQPWMCGQEGGQAVADVLFGDCDPSGRLPITVARHVGQLPVYYNQKRSRAYWVEKGWGRPYVDMNPLPLFPFGFGLSYTSYEYSNLRLDRTTIPTGGEVEVSVDVKNTGARPGVEVVQLYLRDVVSSVSTPVQELKGFERVSLASGQTKTVKFKLTPEHLSLLNLHLERVVEPGTFEVRIGASSADIRLKTTFQVNGS